MAQEMIVAVFETSAQADAAVRSLETAGVPANAIERHEKPSEESPPSGARSAPASTGFFFWDIMFGLQAPHQDRSTYERSLKRGETVVAVTVSEQDAETVMSVLETHRPIDLEEREAVDETATTAVTGQTRAAIHETPASPRTPKDAGSLSSERDTGVEETERAAGVERAPQIVTKETIEQEGDEVIPLGEEELLVGKRTVNRGTTRIRRYVVETPVEKPVSLHDERVIVERRRPVTGEAGDALTEKTVEVTETSEVPVAAKRARLKEEVVVRREGTERTETVRDTVRRDQISIEDASKTSPDQRRANS
jgi:uncharacterized protein (TIGR02271 family)